MTNTTTNTTATTVSTTTRPKKGKPILCVETGTIYASTYDAARALGLPQSSISHVVIGRIKNCHGYTFKRVEETPATTTITRHSAVTVSAEGKYTNKNCKPVLCVETGKIYASGKAAAEDLGVCKNSISNVITGKTNTCNGMHFVLVDNIKEQINRVTGVIRTKNAECKAKDDVIASKTKAYDDKVTELAAKDAELASKTTAYNEIAAKLEAIRSANDIVVSLEESRTEALKLLEKIDAEIATAKAELGNLIKEV